MKKTLILLFLILVIPSVVGGSATRQFSKTLANPNEEITITYAATESIWSLKEKLPTGWIWVTSVSLSPDGYLRDFVSSNSKTYAIKAPSSIGDYTFNLGEYCVGDGCSWTKFSTQTITVGCTPNCAGKQCGDNGCGGSCGTCQSGQTCTNGQCVPQTCSGSSTQSCTIGTCAGTQTRTCNNGVWSDWGSCIKNDPNCGTCADTCSSKGYVCGTQTICGTSVNCGSCSSGMICSNGQCVSGYIEHYEKRCYNDDVYWYDSNGERQDRYDECDSDEECDDGRCEEDCKSKDYKECYNGDVYWYDSCDDRGSKYDDCNDEIEDCIDGKCVSKIRCGNFRCDIGESCSSCSEDCGICQVIQLTEKKEPEKKEVVVVTQPTEKITGFVTQPVTITKEESIFSGTSGNILIGVGIGLGLFIVILLFIWVLRK